MHPASGDWQVIRGLNGAHMCPMDDKRRSSESPTPRPCPMISLYRVLRDVETAKQWAGANCCFPPRMISSFRVHTWIQSPMSLWAVLLQSVWSCTQHWPVRRSITVGSFGIPRSSCSGTVGPMTHRPAVLARCATANPWSHPAPRNSPSQ